MPGFFMNDALRTVVAINFVPLMTTVAVVATFAYRRTGSYVAGAMSCASLVFVCRGRPSDSSGWMTR
jgi:hypothetical protein